MEDSKESKAYSLSEISEEEYEKLGFISIFLTLKKLKLYVFKRNTITGKINSRQAMSRYILLKLLNLKIILSGVR